MAPSLPQGILQWFKATPAITSCGPNCLLSVRAYAAQDCPDTFQSSEATWPVVHLSLIAGSPDALHAPSQLS